MRTPHTLSLLFVATISFVVAGCATVGTRTGIADPAIAQHADVAGLPGIRGWGDEVPKDVRVELRRRAPNLPRLAQSAQYRNGRPVVEVLALSGGGRDGAFGAGLLKGWSARGTRPKFEVVTGVSAGAIIAPFAFLGAEYDHVLEEIWTQYRTSQLVTAQLLPGLLGGDALADTTPLAKLIEKYVDRRMLRAIAAEYRKGRILMIGTTNLDAQRPVVWNMGEIAASNRKGSAALFRKVILASAAIPGAFPPVHIKVKSNGKVYDEMHVDGGTTRELFVSPLDVPFKAYDPLYPRPPIRKLYLIRNSKQNPEQAVVASQTIPIAARAISTLIKSQSYGESYRIYRMAKDAGADFNQIAIPESFDVESKEFFDPNYQRALFDEGFELGRTGIPWAKRPPTKRAP